MRLRVKGIQERAIIRTSVEHEKLKREGLLSTSEENVVSHPTLACAFNDPTR